MGKDRRPFIWTWRGEREREREREKYICIENENITLDDRIKKL
jgi:hypothetical protein